MMVTRVSGTGPTKTVFLSYHSRDSLNKPYRDVVSTYSGNSGVNFIFWKIRDWYASTTGVTFELNVHSLRL